MPLDYNKSLARVKTGLSFIITDIEADGPDPGCNSMLSIASVARSELGEDQGEFTMNLMPLRGAQEDADTMRWWKTQPDAWQETLKNRIEPYAAIRSWADWVHSRPGVPVFAAHPLTFDGAWVDWYLQKFLGARLFDRPRSPGICSGAGVDIQSVIMAKAGWSYQRCNRQYYPNGWLGGHKHSHHALDDARGYAHLLMLALGSGVTDFESLGYPAPPDV